MPAKSQAQQKAFAMALAARRGEIKLDQLRGAAKQLYSDKSLSNDQLADYARTDRKNLVKSIGNHKPQINAKRS